MLNEALTMPEKVGQPAISPAPRRKNANRVKDRLSVTA
jgi:hypothetical protein